MVRLLVACIPSLLLFSGIASANAPRQDPAPPAAGVPDQGKAPGLLSQWELRRRLQQVIDMKDFQVPMTLKETLGLIQEKANVIHREEGALPILVDAAAFKDENPDVPDIYESLVKFAPFPRRLTVANVLRLALSQVPTRNATFVVRGGVVLVTTTERSRPEALLGEKVLANFDAIPLSEALDQVADQTGVSVIVDARVADRVKGKVTAAFNHDVTAGAALRILADMAGLKVVLIDGAAYVTSAENARELEREQAARKEKKPRERDLRSLGPVPRG